MLINFKILSLAIGSYKPIAKKTAIQFFIWCINAGHYLCIAFFLREILNGKIKQNTIFTYIGVIIFLIILNALLGKYDSYFDAKLGSLIKTDLRIKLFKKIFDIGPSYFNSGNTGHVSTIMSSYVEALAPYFSTYLPHLISTVLGSVILVTYLFYVNTLIGIVSLIGILGVLSLPNFWIKLMKERGNEDWKKYSDLSAHLLDVFQGMETIKSFNASSNIRQEVINKSLAIHKNTMEHLAVSQIESGFLQFSAAIGSSFAVALTAFLASNGTIESHRIFIILFLISSCFSPIFSLINTWHLGFRGVSASNFILKLLKVKEEMKIFTASKTKAIEKVQKIKMENVSFGYESKCVLKDVNLIFDRNKITAIVGKSGEGKSTLINLIMGFVTPWTGKIFINDCPIENLSEELYRSKISVVWQDPYMFYGTIMENILIGNPNASKEEVERAAKNAKIHDYIMSLPNGYNSFVGERGMTLSGGQKQRISLARCFLKDSPIIILDEPSSALDGKNESYVQDALKKISKDKIVLIVSHKSQTVSFADSIVVLKGGKVHSQGTHSELLNTNLLYCDLMKNQEEHSA